MKDTPKKLVTESRLAESRNIDKLPSLKILKVISNEDKKVALAVEKKLRTIARAVDLIAGSFRKGGRLFYVGAGTSGRLGVLDASECPPTFGSSPEKVQGIIAGGKKALYRSVEGAEDDKTAAIVELKKRKLSSKDVVVGISASGKTPFAISALEFAKKTGASAIALTCNTGAPISSKADIAIEINAGPEVITGSTRLKAGTAQKMVLNILSTGAFVKSGATYGNLMIDLKPVSNKLKDRAKRILKEILRIDDSEADMLLKKTKGNVKTAVVMKQKSLSYRKAVELLKKSGRILIFAVLILSAFFSSAFGSTGFWLCSSPSPLWGEGKGEGVIASEAKQSPKIALIHSKATIEAKGWRGQYEFDSAVKTLHEIGAKFDIVEDTSLGKEISGYSLLIFPDTRCLPRGALPNIKKFCSDGGKVLSFFQTSYRDEFNKPASSTNDFQLAEVFGASFYRWTEGAEKCRFIIPDERISMNLPRRIELGRETAMLVQPFESSVILGKWLDMEGNPQPEVEEAAIVFNPSMNSIYVSENLFSPENSASLEVKVLIANLINFLLPESVETNPSRFKIAENPAYIMPYQPQYPVKAGGEKITVGLSVKSEEACVISGSEIEIEGELYPTESREMAPKLRLPQNQLLVIRPVAPFMKNPYLALYSEGKLLATAKSKVRIKPASAGEFLSFVRLNGNGTFESKKYRGDIVVLQQDGALDVINELSVEEYISGVVPKEIPSSYPEETLKAMAVIARTFALSHRARHASEGYDLCPTVHCQAYGGVLAEDFSSSKAVEETKGEIILYQGNLAEITYHSTCGGVGENIERVWNAPPCPYLISVYDSPFSYSESFNLSSEDDFKKFIDTPPPSFCKDSSRFRWKEEYTVSQLQELFNESIPVLLRDGKAFQKEVVFAPYSLVDKKTVIVRCVPTEEGGFCEAKSTGFDWNFLASGCGEHRRFRKTPSSSAAISGIGSLYYIKVAERSPRGRVLKLEINTSTGVYYVEKDAIRWLFSGGKIGLGGLRSTLFYIEETGRGTVQKYVFHGGGWGHGVGMCQEGAFGMAKSGYNYIEIIKHYFPGVNINYPAARCRVSLRASLFCSLRPRSKTAGYSKAK